MPVFRVYMVGAMLLLLAAPTALAQETERQPTQVQLQYHELVPADGDSTPAFLKIIDRIRKDCQLVGKAFGRKCVITNINIYANTSSGEMAGRMLNANATIVLPPQPAQTPPASGAVPSSSGAATK
jgi:hypothetical protein